MRLPARHRVVKPRRHLRLHSLPHIDLLRGPARLSSQEYALASREVEPGRLVHHADHGCQGEFN